jgi:hypothetical protein
MQIKLQQGPSTQLNMLSFRLSILILGKAMAKISIFSQTVYGDVEEKTCNHFKKT